MSGSTASSQKEQAPPGGPDRQPGAAASTSSGGAAGAPSSGGGAAGGGAGASPGGIGDAKARALGAAAAVTGAAAAALAAIRSSRLREDFKRIADHARRTSLGQAAALQAAALWQAHSGRATAAAAVGAAYMLYRLALPAAGLLSDWPAAHPALARAAAAAAAAAAVGAGVAYARARAAADPGRVYQLAMLKLNSDPGVLEVMGAPLAGSGVRVEVASGGGVYLSRGAWPPRRRPRRVQMAFEVTGASRAGVAYAAAVKRRGRYDFKLLAVELADCGAGARGGTATAGGGGAAAAGAPGGAAAASGGAAAGGGGAAAEAAAKAAGGAAAAGGGGGGVAHVFLAGDLAALRDGSALRELAAPLARAVAMDARHEVEDDLDTALGHWRAAPAEGEGGEGGGGGGEDLHQLTAWERASRGWAAARLYAKKHLRLGIPKEAPEDAAAAGGGGGGGGGGAAAGEGGQGAGAAPAAKPGKA
ncbi:MAG: hypothetical protein J3K34DRAFT_466998 [Monoraphidium minutum]|nr:MAG: hypothetical protein J3K34DRAFT_466998 [Monoraphidium minutum]